MKWLKKIKEMDRANYEGWYRTRRFTYTKTGYVWDRYLFRNAFVLVLIVIAFAVGDFAVAKEHYYITCEDEYCYNGLYGIEECPSQVPSGLCEQEYILRGEYGERPGFFYYNASFFSIMIISLSFVINHFWHNRRFKIG